MTKNDSPSRERDLASRANQAADGGPAHPRTDAEPSAAFTPGPWFAGPPQPEDDYGAPGDVSVGPYDIAERFGARPDYSPEIFNDHYEDAIAYVSGCNHDAVANARLIAAAPDMYAALDAADEALAQFTAFEADARAIMGNTNFNIVQKRRAQVRAALAKATPPSSGASPHHASQSPGRTSDNLKEQP